MTQKKMIVTEVDVLSGQIIERPFTAKEIQDYEIIQTQEKIFHADQDAKIAARQSALAKLAALGLTEEEIGAL